MTQTVVEWLIEKLDNNLDIKHSWRTTQYIEQAKEMEKKQIIDAYHINPSETKWKNIGENYYKEKFKN